VRIGGSSRTEPNYRRKTGSPEISGILSFKELNHKKYLHSFQNEYTHERIKHIIFEDLSKLVLCFLVFSLFILGAVIT
jgi:hypothetical protein